MGSNSSSPTSYPTPTQTPVSFTFTEFSKQYKNKIKQVVEKFGVNQDVYKNLQYFKQCPLCFSMFTTAFLPNLLQCGHFICNDCLKSKSTDKIKCVKLKCVVKSNDKQCGQTIKIKKEGFILLLECIQQEIVDACHINQCVNFKVQDMRGKTVNLIDQPLTKKLSQLIQGHFQITDQSHHMQINGKPFLYRQYSDKRLIDLAKGIIIYRKVSRKINKLQVFERHQGC